MGTAYTPGLSISRHHKVSKRRLLPIKGEVVVAKGDHVQPDTVVARAMLPGDMESVRVSDALGLEPSELGETLRVGEGDAVEKGQLLAQSKGFFGLFKSQCLAPIEGTVEFISLMTGHVGIRKPPTAIEIPAYIKGTVTEVLPGAGVVVETHGAFIQGIFGVGGERQGVITVVAENPQDELTESEIPADCKGQILIGGSVTTAGALQRAVERGAVGIVVGGIVDRDLAEYVGHDIGVAITGQEPVGAALIVTEGFGKIAMALRTFELLKSLDGLAASINGATQIRAGAMRPEIIVPASETNAETQTGLSSDEAHQLEIGTQIRVIRVPYFGAIGAVSALPAELVEIDSGSLVRVLEATLEDGKKVVVPRANVEIMQST